MSEQEWSIELARAKLLRIAADFITDGYLEHEAQTLINEAMGVNHGRGFADEQGFRGILSAVLCWEEQEIAPAVAEVYGEAGKDDRAAALMKAIRAITVDLPNDEPNGEAERQIDNLLAAIDHIKHWSDRDPAMRIRVGRISDAGAKLCAALADDTQKLREAAEAYFGGDFGKPDPSSAPAAAPPEAPAVLQKEIVYFGERCVLACDGRCDKAWGIQARPRHRSEPEDVEPDDYVYLGDDHVGEAPPPGKTGIISEGFEMKPSAVPLTDPALLNKWCARQCERSTIAKTGEPVVLPDMKSPEPNMPHRRRSAS